MKKYPLINLAKCFLKHKLNLNLSSMSPKPLAMIFSPTSSIDRVLVIKIVGMLMVEKCPNGRNINRNDKY